MVVVWWFADVANNTGDLLLRRARSTVDALLELLTLVVSANPLPPPLPLPLPPPRPPPSNGSVSRCRLLLLLDSVAEVFVVADLKALALLLTSFGRQSSPSVFFAVDCGRCDGNMNRRRLFPRSNYRNRNNKQQQQHQRSQPWATANSCNTHLRLKGR